MKKATKFINCILIGMLILFLNGCNGSNNNPPSPGCSVSLLSDQVMFTNNGNTIQRFYIVNYINGVDPRNPIWMALNKRDDFTLRPGESVIKTYQGASAGVGICSPSNSLAANTFDYASVRNIIRVNMGTCCKYNGTTVSNIP